MADRPQLTQGGCVDSTKWGIDSDAIAVHRGVEKREERCGMDSGAGRAGQGGSQTRGPCESWTAQGQQEKEKGGGGDSTAGWLFIAPGGKRRQP